jgi:ubiquinone/menaquinone biosynthesis C-methylase UbiE
MSDDRIRSARELLVLHWTEKPQFYDDIEGNALTSGALEQAWLRVLSRALPSKCHDVLEVGVGTGVLHELLGTLNLRLFGIDISHSMVAATKSRLRHRGVSSALVVADAERLPFAPESFDLIICRYTAWTLFELEDTLKSWRSCLRPQGRLVCIENARLGPVWVRRTIYALARLFFTAAGRQTLMQSDDGYAQIRSVMYFKDGFKPKKLISAATGVGFSFEGSRRLNAIRRLEVREASVGHRLMRTFSVPTCIVFSRAGVHWPSAD